MNSPSGDVLCPRPVVAILLIKEVGLGVVVGQRGLCVLNSVKSLSFCSQLKDECDSSSLLSQHLLKNFFKTWY